MIDINLIRQDHEAIRQRYLRRGKDIDFTEFLQLDEQRKAIIQSVEQMKAQRNKVSAQIPQLKKAGQDVSATIAEMKALGDKIAQEVLATSFNKGIAVADIEKEVDVADEKVIIKLKVVK